MLPPFIIEQIRQREEQQRARRHEQPRLELPLEIQKPGRHPSPAAPAEAPSEEEAEDRGVTILDLG